jgi:uncharacterized protein
VKESRYNIWVERDGAAYVYNGMSGALLRVPVEQSRALRAGLPGDAPDGCAPELLKRLALGRMLLADEADELDLLAKRYSFTRHDRSHLALTIVTSLGCNFDCPYCFEAKHPSILSPEVEQSVLRLLDAQLPRIRTFDVTWFGGEPLVGKRPLLALSDAFIGRCDATKVTYSASIVTNGYLLTRETCAELRERRVTSAQVSLDGPPDVHDRMRPLVGGGRSFRRIVENLHHAVEMLDIAIRVNVDTGNIGRVEELLRILAGEGFSGKLTVYPGQIVGVADMPTMPSARYKVRCLTNPEFAQAALAVDGLVARYGFGRPGLPRPTGAPCTAVRSNELVVGSKGELYKCWDSVGNPLEVIGHIGDYENLNGRRAKWLAYDPFANDECRGCIALPVCMGGCAHHAMDKLQYENRCGAFRHTHAEQVRAFVEMAETTGSDDLLPAASLVRRMETR